MKPKPIDELVRADLHAFPLWEYATDAEEECDETCVRPVERATIPSSHDYVVYHVVCDVVSAHGANYIGFMSLCNGELHDDAPVVVGAQRGEYFCIESAPQRRQRAAFEAVFGVEHAALFPLRWTLRLRVEGETAYRSGRYSPP